MTILNPSNATILVFCRAVTVIASLTLHDCLAYAVAVYALSFVQ